MTAAVIFPWRAGDPDREASFEFVQAWVGGLGLPYGAYDVGGAVFNRAASKNLGASEWPVDVVIFHDADMILPREAYGELIERAADTGVLVVGFAEYRPLSKEVSALIYAGGVDPFDAPSWPGHVNFSLGGIIAIRRDAFVEVGGYDERFRGWGCEDFAFAIACGAVLGPTGRIDGPGLHFFHEHATLYQDAALENENSLLLQRYNRIHNVEELREVQGLR